MPKKSEDPGDPKRIQTKTHVINFNPRMSAQKLAEFMVADHSRKLTLIRNSKVAPIMLSAPYTKVRSSLKQLFTENGYDSEGFRGRAILAEQPKEDASTWAQRDDRNSAEAFRCLAELANLLAVADGSPIHKPQGGWKPLKLSGVEVSISPEVVFQFQHRGVQKTGGIILNTGKGKSLSLAKVAGKHSAGDYLAMLLNLSLAQNVEPYYGGVAPGRCQAVDIFRKAIYTAPPSQKRMINDIHGACAMIAAFWPMVPLPDGVSQSTEESEGDWEY